MRHEKPAVVEDLPLSAGLRSLLAECWHKDPAQRPVAASCSQVLRDDLGEQEVQGVGQFSQSNATTGVQKGASNFSNYQQCSHPQEETAHRANWNVKHFLD